MRGAPAFLSTYVCRMQPFLILGSAIAIIIASGAAVYSAFPAINPILFAWLWFNLWIAAYEIYIVYNRRNMSPEQCKRPDEFWTRDSGPLRFWKEAWNEYACVADNRYLDPRDFVFVIESINAVMVAALIYALYAKSAPVVIAAILLLQAYHCVIYFASWASYKKRSGLSMKSIIYLLISAIWIFGPLYILSCKEYT